MRIKNKNLIGQVLQSLPSRIFNCWYHHSARYVPRIGIRIAAVAACALLGRNVWGTLIFSEAFDYTAGAQLPSPYTSANTSQLVQSPTLTYSGLTSLGGNRLVTSGGTGGEKTGSKRDFGDQTSGNVYFSFLLRVNDASGIGTSSPGTTIFQTHNNGGGTKGHISINLLNDSGNINVGVAKYPDSGTPNATAFFTSGNGFNISANGTTTYLIVGKYSFVSGTVNDTITVWVNPVNLGGESEDANSSSFVTTGAGTADGTTGIGRFYLCLGYYGDIDDIRIGTTWADVTPSAGCNSATITSDISPLEPTVNINATASFAFAADGSSPGYQWQVSTDGGGTWSNVSTGTGGATPNYTTSPLGLSDSGTKFRCVATVACNGSSVTSSVATVTVIDASGYSFHSITSGNWNDVSTWEQTTNGMDWSPAVVTPSSGCAAITVRAGHNVVVTAPVTINDAVIEAEGQVTVNGGTLNVSDGSATETDLDVAGTLQVDSDNPVIVDPGALVHFTGTYRWNSPTVGNIPTAVWDTNSTCEIANGSSSGNTGTPPTGLNQSFYHFYWNWPGCQRCSLSNELTTIRGNFRVNGAPNADYSVRFLMANGTCNVTVDGDVILESGYMTLSGGSAAYTIVNWYVGGNFLINGGAALDSRSSDLTSSANIYFINTANAQSFTNAGNIIHTGEGGGCPINWYVNSGCTLNLYGNLMLGTGGSGTLHDSVTVDGTLQFNGSQLTGNQINTNTAGVLTVNSGGTLVGTGTSQLVASLNNVNYGGTLNLPDLPTFNDGDSFLLFNATTYSGSLTLVPATPGAGQIWDTSTFFTTDGVLRVSGGGGGGIHIDSVMRLGTDLILSGSGGLAYGNFNLMSATNVNTALEGWSSEGDFQFDENGNFTVTNTISGATRKFYIIQQP